mgnify:CR=1 FL=1
MAETLTPDVADNPAVAALAEITDQEYVYVCVEPVLEAVRLKEPPRQTAAAEAVAVTGSVGSTVAVRSVLAPSHPVEAFVSLTHHCVVLLTGVVKVAPVFTILPPVAASYHLNRPVPPPSFRRRSSSVQDWPQLRGCWHNE